MQQAQTITIQERALDEIPEYYDNPAAGVATSRLEGMDVNNNLPRLVEIIRGSTMTNQNGGVQKKEIFVNQVHKNIPLVVGLAILPDGRHVKLPHGDVGIDWGYATIGIIRTTSVEVHFNLGPDNKFKTCQYKLFVYNLDLIEDV